MEQPRLISPRKINSSLSAVDNCSMIIRETLSEVKNYGATAHADFVSLVFVSSLLFVLQTLTGGLIAHYRAEPEGFFGIDFSAILPFNIMAHGTFSSPYSGFQRLTWRQLALLDASREMERPCCQNIFLGPSILDWRGWRS